MHQLRSECENDLEYQEKLADRSIIPRKPDFNRLYSLFTKEKYGASNLESMYEKLEEKINYLKEQSEDYSFLLQKYNQENNEPFILVVVTPLMKRVHQMVPNSKDLVFCDSSSNMEEFNLRVFMMVTHSVCGALPLGIIITSDEQGKTLESAFQMFKECVESFGFYGSSSGPQVIMTDNCDELRDSLLFTWPTCILVLCIFHILQSEKSKLIDQVDYISLSKY